MMMRTATATRLLTTTTTTTRTKTKPREVVLSGIQPTGVPHLGNYLGALRDWVKMQPAASAAVASKANENKECFYSLMDLHALTVPRPGAELKRDIADGACTLLACGLKPEPGRCRLFVQSDVKQHTELAWFLSCVATVGQLERMTQYKEKAAARGAATGGKGPTLGLMSYAVLMAADILVYKATTVPVGEDQVQHLELARDLAQAFGREWKYAFVLPNTKMGRSRRVMSLTDASKKMSKSDPLPNSRILLTDDADQIAKKIRTAKTDSLGPIVVGESLDARPEVRNLLEILNAVSGDVDQTSHVAGLNMGDFKKAVTDAVVREVVPIGKEIARLRGDLGYVGKVLSEGAEEARDAAEATMREVRAVLGVGSFR